MARDVYNLYEALYGRLMACRLLRATDRASREVRGYAGIETAFSRCYPDAPRAIATMLCPGTSLGAPCPTCMERAHRILAVEAIRTLAAELILSVAADIGTEKARREAKTQ